MRVKWSVPEISRRLDDDPAADLRARALVASAIACAIDTWITGGGTTPLPVLLDQSMGTLSELST